MKTPMVLVVVMFAIMTQANASYYDDKDISDMRGVLKRLLPGQVLLECSNKAKYPMGCCRNNKPVPIIEGLDKDQACARALCYDIAPDSCKTLNCEDKYTQKKCPYTCNKCQHRASPKDECEKSNPIFGCCWNGLPATGPNNRGCPPCMNLKSRRLCKMFRYDVKCMSGRYGTTQFLVANCAKFCGLCK